MTSPPRIIAGIFIFTASAVIVSTALMFWLGSQALQTHAREQSHRAAILNFNWLVATSQKVETSQREYLLTGDETYLQPLNDGGKQLASAIAQIREIPHLDLRPEAMQTIVRLVQERMRELRTAVDLRRNGDTEGSIAISRKGHQKSMDGLQATVGRLEQEQVEKLQKDSRATDEAIRLRTLVFLLAGCGNILFLGWAYHRISHSIEEREAAAIMHRPLE